MARGRHRVALTFALAAALSCTAPIPSQDERLPDAGDDSRRISATAFFRDPTLSLVMLSPDGKHLAALHSANGTHTLMVRRTRGGEIRPLAKIDETGMLIRRIGWASDMKLLFSVEMPNPEAAGVSVRQTRLFVVGRKRAEPRYIGERWPSHQDSQFQDQIIDWLWDDPGHVLINYREPGDTGASARVLDVKSGRLLSFVEEKPDVDAWHSDHRGRVRVAEGMPLAGTRYFFYARISGLRDFEKIIDYDPLEEPGFKFAGFSEHPWRIYVWSQNESERTSLYEYDLRSKSLGSKVFGHPEFDATELHYSRKSGRLLAVGYASHRPELHFVDEAARLEQQALDQVFPGTINRIVSTDRNETLAILRVSGDTTPPSYYLFDRVEKRLGQLFSSYPQLRSETLAPMRPISFRARDGLEIHGYLTLPSEGRSSNLPTIVYPHVGPSSRDVWDWNPTVQFFASRGFAVLQLNFRGSTGYGSNHMAAGYREWGLAMQDDITDGVRWLIEQRVADSQRIGIYGAGYGGYVALMGAVKTPELFRAAASFAAVTDLQQMNADGAWYSFHDSNHPPIGPGSSDRQRLELTSPVENVERIRAPILIAHGTADPVVHVKQAEAMSRALQEAGKEVEIYLYPDEVHGFLDERNRMDFHERLAAFFERHLGRATPSL